jgi:putative flippase GtrA
MFPKLERPKPDEQNNFFCHDMNTVPRQFIKYCVVGLNNVFVAYSVFYVLLVFWHVHYMVAGALGFVAAIFPACWLNRAWTFKSDVSVRFGLPRYIALTLFIFSVHSSTQWLSTEVLSTPEVLSQLIGICVTTLVNFLLARRYVFGG